MRHKAFSVVTLVILAILLIAIPVFATVGDPDSITIPMTGAHMPVRVFQNLWATGDQLYVMEYDVYYTPDNPDESPAETFLMAIYNGSSLVATRPLNNYGHNVTS